jgi:hypothetical protein
MLFHICPTPMSHGSVLKDTGQLLGEVYRVTRSGETADSRGEETRGTPLIDCHYWKT